MVCCSGVRRRFPGNFIMLGIFTLALSYVTGTIASFYETSIVVMTIGITAAICFLITLFATQTKVSTVQSLQSALHLIISISKILTNSCRYFIEQLTFVIKATINDCLCIGIEHYKCGEIWWVHT